jgi:hypothetical protein
MHVDRLVFPSVDHPATSAGVVFGRCRSSTFFGDKAEEQRPLPGVKSLFVLHALDRLMHLWIRLWRNASLFGRVRAWAAVLSPEDCDR